MTSADQPGPPSEGTHEPSEGAREPSQEAHEPSQDTHQQPAGKFSLSRNKSGWLGITLSVILLACVSAALVAVAVGGGAHKSTPGGPSAGPAAAPSPTSSNSSKTGQLPNGTSTAKSNGTSTAKSKITSATQLAESGGAINLPASTQSSAARWQSGPGGTDLAAVSSRFGAALQAGGARQYSAMKYACAQLASSVPTAQAGPPIPYAAMQKLYAKALAELAQGAADCRKAISVEPDGDEGVQTHVDPTLLRQSMSELAAGAEDIFRSTAEIEIVSRQHH